MLYQYHPPWKAFLNNDILILLLPLAFLFTELCPLISMGTIPGYKAFDTLIIKFLLCTYLFRFITGKLEFTGQSTYKCVFSHTVPLSY